MAQDANLINQTTFNQSSYNGPDTFSLAAALQLVEKIDPDSTGVDRRRMEAKLGSLLEMPTLRWQNQPLITQLKDLRKQDESIQLFFVLSFSSRYISTLFQRVLDQDILVTDNHRMLNFLSNENAFFARYCLTPRATQLRHVHAERLIRAKKANHSFMDKLEACQFLSYLIVHASDLNNALPPHLQQGVISTCQAWITQHAAQLKAGDRYQKILERPQWLFSEAKNGGVLSETRSSHRTNFYACPVSGCQRSSLLGDVMLMCSKCRVQVYCSHTHQEAHWAQHKPWCFENFT